MATATTDVPKRTKPRSRIHMADRQETVSSNRKLMTELQAERDRWRGDFETLRDFAKGMGDIVAHDANVMPSWRNGGFETRITHAIGEFIGNSRWWQPVRDSISSHFTSDVEGYNDAKLVRATGAWTVLAKTGLSTEDSPPLERWEPTQLACAKSVARLICGEVKSAIAESLTPTETAEFHGILAGLKAGLRMAQEFPDPSTAPRDIGSNQADRFTLGSNWVRARARTIQSMVPDRFYKLLLEPDACPWLMWPVMRKVHEHFKGDYAETARFCERAIHELSEQAGEPDSEIGEPRLRDVLDDDSLPIADRVKAASNAFRRRANKNSTARWEQHERERAREYAQSLAKAEQRAQKKARKEKRTREAAEAAAPLAAPIVTGVPVDPPPPAATTPAATTPAAATAPAAGRRQRLRGRCAHRQPRRPRRA